ncbi:sterol desaturase family protein [Flavicella sediminum]|uniref:sterol desaturase family protein n=1 Tax=Flavicella sediminum TaxID=2585141 RepID=UPI0011238E87|nr:sterol desaturase family protein [Flavicella sediminum]
MKEDKYLWIVASVVLFIIGVEYLFSRTKGKTIFRFQNTISNLLMGIFDRVAGLFMVPLIYFYYEYLYLNFALFFIPESILFFCFAVLISDFIWYFYHKAGHRINFFWGAHIIHHQSEDYNYSVALNLTPFQVIIRVLFWSLMPVLGFKPEVVLGTHLVIGLYQFLLHTTLIPKLGFVEKLFVTPSHHRVHHGSNTEYLDKNFGGILIIWDKLFGSFQEEEKEVQFGITKDVNSRDFMTSVFHYYQNLLFKMRQLATVKEKCLLLVKGPDWVPVSGEIKELPLYIEKGTYQYTRFSFQKKVYIILNIVLLFAVLILLAYLMNSFSFLQLWLIALFLLTSLVLTGKILEGLRFAYFEVFRIGLVLIFLWDYLHLFS